MNSIRWVSILVMLLLLLSGCEDRGYGTQDITVVPSVTGSEKMHLLGSVPSNGGNIAQRAYINLSFSSYVDEGTVTSTHVKLLKGNHEVATEFLVLRNFIYIKPLQSLEESATYTVRVEGLKDIFNNDLEQNYVLSFSCTSDFWQSTEAGVSNSMAQSKAGDLYIWGSNAPLPIDTEAEEIKVITIDMPLPVPNTNAVMSYDVGPNTMAMVLKNGNIIELGLSAFSDHSDQGYRRVSAGKSHSAVLKEDGSLFSWGSNDRGQLGASLLLNSSTTPIQEYTVDNNWSAVSAGAEFTVAMKKDGTLWGWGDNTFGQVGRRFDTIPLPLELNTSGTTISSVEKISGGDRHTLALDDKSRLWAWGNNEQGALGDGSNISSRVGTAVSGNQVWQFVTAGSDHTLAIDDNASLWAWGNNGSGQLGVGSTVDANVPKREGNTTRKWTQVSAGKNYTLGVTTDGRLWAWGTNTYLRLGLDESVTQTDVPMEVR